MGVLRGPILRICRGLDFARRSSFLLSVTREKFGFLIYLFGLHSDTAWIYYIFVNLFIYLLSVDWYISF